VRDHDERRLLAHLPAGAVAAATARAATDLLVAVAAIDGLVAARLERHTSLPATRRADSGIHLARRSLPTVRAATAHRSLARRAAFRAARRRVHQPFACVKFLLAGREHELTTALATPKRLIGGQNCLPLFRLDRASGDGADHAPRPWRKPSRHLEERCGGSTAGDRPEIQGRRDTLAGHRRASASARSLETRRRRSRLRGQSIP